MAVEFLQDTNINGTFIVKGNSASNKFLVSDTTTRVYNTLRIDLDLIANSSYGTTGQVLTSNGSGAAATWETLTNTGTVDGTGVANYIAKWSDTDTITTSGIFDNGTNVGINTTSPAALLDVNKENAESVVRISRGGSDLSASTAIGALEFWSDYLGSPIQYAEINASSSPVNGLRGSIDFNVKSTSGNILNGLSIYGTNSNGVNVGIGTNFPSQKLVVADDGAHGIALEPNYSNSGRNLIQSYNYSTTGYVSTNYNALDHRFDTSGAEKVRITTAGHVGILTTAPGSELEVAGLTQTDKFRYDYPTSDGSYRGEVADFGVIPFSGAPSEGDIVYLNSSGAWVAAQANNDGARNLLGFYDGTDVILRGPVRSGSGGGGTRIPAPTPTPTDGEPLYLSPDTAGGIFALSNLSSFASGEYIRIIGHIIDYSADSFYFNPDSTWVKKA